MCCALRTRSQTARLFQALGSIERLQLMERLLDQEHCVSELAHELEEKVTTISQRLQQLHQAPGSKERRGKHIYYSIADHHVRELLTNTFDHVEEGGCASAAKEHIMSECTKHEQHDHVHGPGCGHQAVSTTDTSITCTKGTCIIRTVTTSMST